MRRLNYKFLLRKSHRYLGVFIGLQFLLWTVGGLYFSWTNIDEIRGDTLRQHDHAAITERDFVSPRVAIDELRKSQTIDSVAKLELIQIFGEPFYEIAFVSDGKERVEVVSATGAGKRAPLTEAEARQIATAALKKPAAVAEAMFLTTENVGAHHEYREKPLPAWAVSFENGPTVYVAAQTGKIGAVRTDSWRVFDFLWMLHTMDFKARDDINNYVLRAFSILGIVTILSGFMLFFVSSRSIRRIIFRRNSR